MLLKNIESYTEKNTEEKDLMSDVRYVCKSCSLITESLQKGCDVMQMPNGDIIVTELKTVVFQYTWDDKKGKLVRNQANNKTRKRKTKELSKEYEVESLKIDELV